MESQNLNKQQDPQSLSPSSSGRRTTDCSNSPEFEFWMLRNPSFPQPDLHSADELFADGVLLPLHLLKSDLPHQTPDSEPPAQDPDPEPEPEPEPAIIDSSPSTFSASKRWKDIFKKKTAENNNNSEEKEKEKGSKKKDRKGSGSAGGTSSAELNINIWPFSRSRSAGNATTRPKLFPGAPTTRKVNSAPCSRSNSAGENKSRKWPSSPGRAGVHVGRSSPVWQVRRTKNSDTEKGSQREPTTRTANTTARRSKFTGGTGKAKVLNLNVPMCIGYRNHLSCRSDENSAIGVSARGSGNNNSGSNCNNNSTDNSNNGGSGGNLFNLRNLFTKKGIVTSH